MSGNGLEGMDILDPQKNLVLATRRHRAIFLPILPHPSRNPRARNLSVTGDRLDPRVFPDDGIKFLVGHLLEGLRLDLRLPLEHNDEEENRRNPALAPLVSLRLVPEPDFHIRLLEFPLRLLVLAQTRLSHDTRDEMILKDLFDLRPDKRRVATDELEKSFIM